jgi:hypothetical protein
MFVAPRSRNTTSSVEAAFFSEGVAPTELKIKTFSFYKQVAPNGALNDQQTGFYKQAARTELRTLDDTKLAGVLISVIISSYENSLSRDRAV